MRSEHPVGTGPDSLEVGRHLEIAQPILPLSLDLQRLHDQLLMRMGRNLMGYQGIEWSLKLILKYSLLKSGKPSSVPGENGKLPTLGVLVTAFIDCLNFRPDDPSVNQDLFQSLATERVRKVVADRNTLAHTFFEIPGVDSYSKEGLEKGIQRLDAMYREALLFNDDLTPLLFLYTEILLARPSPIPELRVMNTLLRAYAQQRGLQISVHDRNYEEIIELLQLAEREGPKQHEMTPLTWAGRYIYKSMPEFSPEL